MEFPTRVLFRTSKEKGEQTGPVPVPVPGVMDYVCSENRRHAWLLTWEMTLAYLLMFVPSIKLYEQKRMLHRQS